MSLLRIDEIFNFEKGVLQSSKCVPGEYDFITASSDWKTHNEFTHECEALIFAAAASGSLGRTHYVNGKFISSDLCFVITPKDQGNLPVDLKFYHILFNELKDEIVRNTKAGTSKEAIGLGSFGKYQLPYFDIDTQIEIKNRFVKSEELKSDLSNELNHQVDLVKKLRQQLLQDAVQGKLVERNLKDEPASELFKKIKAEKQKLIAEKTLKKEKELPPIKPEEIPFEIPENWVWCRGEIVATYIDPHPSHRTPPESSDGVPYIAMSDIRKDGTLDFNSARKVSRTVLEEHQNRYKLQDGDFIFGKIGTIGKPVKLPYPFNYTLSANVILIQPERKFVNQDYLFYFLSSPAAEKNLIENKSTMSYPVFGMGKARNMPIPLPPLAEQNRIVHKLDELMQYCNELEASIKQSETQNSTLLQQVLREALRKEPVEV